MKFTCHITVITGLGKTTGDYFVSSLRKQLKRQNLEANIEKRLIDVNSIIPVLQDEIKVGHILLNTLFLPSYNKPDLVLIPCNSVHIASPYLKQAFGGRFLAINEAVMSLIKGKRKQGRFLILGTSTTIEAGFYQEGLHQLGYESLTLPIEDQAMLDTFIFRKLVEGKMNFEHLRFLRKLETRFMRMLGADYVILACTELCYLVQGFSHKKSYEIDSLQALHDTALAHVRYLTEEKLTHANRYTHVMG